MATIPLNKKHYQQIAGIIQDISDSKLAADAVVLYVLYVLEAEQQGCTIVHCTNHAAGYKLRIKAYRVQKAKAELRRLGLVENQRGRLGADGVCRQKECVRLLQY